MNKNQTNALITLLSAILIAVIVLIIVSAHNRKEVVKNTDKPATDTTTVVETTTKGDTNLMQEDGLIHPKAPGAWVMSGVKNISPATLVVGENKINANVKGLFVDNKVMVKVYDNLTEVASAEAEAVVDPIENEYVAVKTFSLTIPETMKGKTLIVRFIKPGTEAGYWGTTMMVK